MTWTTLSPDSLSIPDDWEVIAAADVGTYMGGVVCALPPGDDPELFVLEEFPNYHYVSGTIELLGMTVREWVRWMAGRLRHYTKEESNVAWTDRNTQFVTEVGWGLTLRRNFIHMSVRTEVTREYFQHGRIHLAPWLRVLPYEIENASWPDTETVAQHYTRVKKKDHTLDPLEHVCSRRPRNGMVPGSGKPSFKDSYLATHRKTPTGPADLHLGDL